MANKRTKTIKMHIPYNLKCCKYFKFLYYLLHILAVAQFGLVRENYYGICLKMFIVIEICTTTIGWGHLPSRNRVHQWTAFVLYSVGAETTDFR